MLNKLTPEQEARMSEWAARWIDALEGAAGTGQEGGSQPEIGQSTEPADWEAFEDAARRCYEFSGLRWHGNVIHVSSPFALALAAPMAAYLIERRAVGGAVDGAVRDAVGDAVDGAVHGHRELVDRLRATIRSRWFYRLGGQWWVAWNAYTSFFRDVAGLELPGDTWDRDRAYADAQSAAGWWWPHREFVMVSDRPSTLHLEQIGEPGWGSHRLHCADGPAIRWRDGWALHYWHGVQVPADLIEGEGWSAKRILEERNQEYRRCAIERMGWDRFIADAGLERIGELVPDPGNPGGDLALYDIPEQIFDEPVRVLLCLNGTTERDGSRRRYGLTVPASFSDPVAAAAWTYGWPTEAYRQLEVRR